MKLLVALFAMLSVCSECIAQTIKLGSKVEVQWSGGIWYPAIIIDESDTQYKIHLDGDGASSARDQWISKNMGLIRGVNNNATVKPVSQAQVPGVAKNDKPSATKTPGASSTEAAQSSTNTARSLNIGANIEAKQGNRWYAARIKEIKEARYLVKYNDYNEEEWVTIDRLRFKNFLPVEKLSGNAGKVYIRSMLWIATGFTELSWWFLGDNGVVVNNPVSGVNPINLAMEQENNFKNVGTYVIQGDMIKMTWLNGTTTNLGLKYRNGEIIEMDAGGIMVRQRGLGDNYRINGTFSGRSSFGNVSSAGKYTFSRDGSVIVSKAGYVTTTDVAGKSENSKQGKYNIKGNTLSIVYTDGTKENSTIGTFGQDKLVIDGGWLTLQ